MAIAFEAASSEHLTITGEPFTDYPATVAAWFKCPDAEMRTIYFYGDAATRKELFILRAQDQKVTAGNRDGNGFVKAQSSITYTTGVWQHACGVFAGASDRRAYLNGGNEGTEATACEPSGQDTVKIGAGMAPATGNPNLFWDGDLAWLSVWTAALSAAEIAVLGAGVSPLLVRPDALAAFWPLWYHAAGDGGMVDVVGGDHATTIPADFPSNAPHPGRLILPAAIWPVTRQEAAVGGVAVKSHHYRQLRVA